MPVHGFRPGKVPGQVVFFVGRFSDEALAQNFALDRFGFGFFELCGYAKPFRLERLGRERTAFLPCLRNVSGKRFIDGLATAFVRRFAHFEDAFTLCRFTGVESELLRNGFVIAGPKGARFVVNFREILCKRFDRRASFDFNAFLADDDAAAFEPLDLVMRLVRGGIGAAGFVRRRGAA